MKRGVFDPAGRAVKTALGGDINLTADNRLYPGILSFTIKLYCPEHIAVVGNGQGRHLVEVRGLDKFLDLAGAV